MLKLTNPRLRRSDVVLDSFDGCVTDAPKEFSRTPKMPFSKVISQPRMFFEKAESTVAFKQLKCHTNTHSRRHLNKQMDMVNTDVKFINFEPFSVSDLSQKKLTIHSKPVELERIFGVFNFPDKMEGILSEAVFSGFQIHFSSPKSAMRNRAHANFDVYFEEPSISAFPNNQTKELNLLEDGDSSLL
jgi:hypothetical protein